VCVHTQKKRNIGKNWHTDLKQPPLASNHIERDHYPRPEEEKERLKKKKKRNNPGKTDDPTRLSVSSLFP
jgi:hypothetical protein